MKRRPDKRNLSSRTQAAASLHQQASQFQIQTPDEKAEAQPEVAREVRRLKLIIAILLIAIFSLAPYLNSLRNEFVFDDTKIIVENRTIRRLSNIPTIFTSHYWHPLFPQSDLYRPITILSYALNYAVGKLDPFGYHLVNILLHFLICLLIYFLVLKLYGSNNIALAAALLFGAHPIHVEAVTGVVGRADLLSTLFVLAALWLYIKYRETQAAYRADFYIASLALYLLGLLSKESAIVLLGLLFIYDLSFGREARQGFSMRLRQTKPGALIPYLGYLGIIALYFILRYSVLKAWLRPSGFKSDMIDNPLLYTDVYTRVLTALKVILKYLKLLFVPTNLSPDYSYNQIPVVTSPFQLQVLAALGALVLLGYLALSSLRRGEPDFFFPIAFFLAAFLPVSNIFYPIGTIMAERLLYLPSVGFCLALAIALEKLFNLRPLANLRQARAATLAALLLAFSYLTIKQNIIWKDEYSLFSYLVRVSPNSVKGHVNLGFQYRKKGQLDKAIDEYKQALKIKPDFIFGLNHLGATYGLKGSYAEAIGELEAALKLNPNFYLTLNNLGVVYFNMRKFDEAIKYLEKAVRSNPNHIDSRLNLAMVYQAKGEANKALEQYRKVVELDPENVQGRYGLGAMFLDTKAADKAINELTHVVLLQPDHLLARIKLGQAFLAKGLADEAIRSFEHAIKLKPDYAEAYIGLGEAYAFKDLYDDAIRTCKKALELRPDIAEFHLRLGNIYAERGQDVEAIAEFYEAIRLKPDLAEAHNSLGMALARQGQLDDAIAQLEEAIRLQPSFPQPYFNLGNLYKQKGMNEKASECFRTFFKRMAAANPQQFQLPSNEIYSPRSHREQGAR